MSPRGGVPISRHSPWFASLAAQVDNEAMQRDYGSMTDDQLVQLLETRELPRSGPRDELMVTLATDDRDRQSHPEDFAEADDENDPTSPDD